MKGYKQLTREQRYQLYGLKKEHHNQTEMARNLGMHKSTIARELKRNQGQCGYRPKQADDISTSTPTNNRAARSIAPELSEAVAQTLRRRARPGVFNSPPPQHL